MWVYPMLFLPTMYNLFNNGMSRAIDHPVRIHKLWLFKNGEQLLGET
jgi:hypothetical protein